MNTPLMVGICLTLGVAASAAGRAAGAPPLAYPKEAAVAVSDTIHQEVDFTASPKRIYDALLDSKQFTSFAGRPSTIDPKVGGTFSLFGGPIVGMNIELVSEKRIVQAWRVATWPEGVYSIATFTLVARGTGTHLVFDQAGFPPAEHDHLTAGWSSNYWTPLKAYLK